MSCDPRRYRILRERDDDTINEGPVVYWMFRDLRVEHNWALLKAQEMAKSFNRPLRVLFVAVPGYMCWNRRHFHFVFEGLKEIRQSLLNKKISLEVTINKDPVSFLKQHLTDIKASALVTDFLPLREKMAWDKELSQRVDISMLQVDAHNIVPVWEASDKLEYAARTLRPKIFRKMHEFLVEFPPVATMTKSENMSVNTTEDALDQMYKDICKTVTDPLSAQVGPVVDYFVSGIRGGEVKLAAFLDKKRLGRFDTHRNDPNQHVLSGLSPYFTFGFISAQSVILRVNQYAKENNISSEAVKAYVEEAVVRRELSDNYCMYNPHYDSLLGAYPWARETLELHANDRRQWVYTLEQFANSQTHDELWNAAQKQLYREGKMHGFLRMYWAKKILEWTSSPKEALDIAIRLNDEYSLDGCCPNGFVGVGWSIMGIHDQGFREREIFGKIRYMNLAGCNRKFNTEQFITEYKSPQKASENNPFKKRKID